MKKNFLALIAFLSIVACSSDDDSVLSEIQSQLIGKWYFENPSTNPEHNNSFTFTSNGTVTYTNWNPNSESYISEDGSYSFDGDIMTMTFPEGVTLTFIQKVVFISENIVEFQETDISGSTAYVGDYFREGEVNESNNDELTIIIDTGNVMNSSWGSSCYGLSSSTENINTKLTFSSDGEIVNDFNYSMPPGYQIDEEQTVSGDLVSVKLELTDFDPQILNKDIDIYDINVSIENEQGEVILNEGLGELYYCTDSRYEVTFTYNVNDNTFSIDEQTYSF
ncbi:hypothetical protein [Zunongwangia pacifica]|uniref:Lipocalin-like domain-containing protein n=1 Tax=Zunongwangia pacifica TaxID=2911062 RepID=A0A9X2CPY9_9FLAO|nr:hypothetical protein [Zunongwangia pacifica]MCL6218582.1 hypothetical protein [Zunongwangia pacifica]